MLIFVAGNLDRGLKGTRSEGEQSPIIRRVSELQRREPLKLREKLRSQMMTE